MGDIFNMSEDVILVEPCYLVGDTQSKNHLKTIFGNATIDGEGYYRISSKKEGNHMKKLHKLIVEYFYKIKLPQGWVVHHKNKNKLDNRITNLEVILKQKHDKLHGISDETSLKLSKIQNNTGYYRVSKHKDISCRQGFIWRYKYYENGIRKEIESVDLDKLKEKVIMKELEWRKL